MIFVGGRDFCLPGHPPPSPLAPPAFRFLIAIHGIFSVAYLIIVIIVFRVIRPGPVTCLFVYSTFAHSIVSIQIFKVECNHLFFPDVPRVFVKGHAFYRFATPFSWPL